MQVGSNDFLNPVAGGTGPELKMSGAAVEFNADRRLDTDGVRQTATGYEIAWKLTGHQPVYGVEHRQQRQLHLECIGVVRGTSTTLESLETTFQQDLNGDGTIGIPTVVIQTDGSTSLVQVGSNYFLYPVGGLGPRAENWRHRRCGRVSSAAGRRSARSKRRPDMTLPGSTRVPISIRCGTPTATATTSQMHWARRRDEHRAGDLREHFPAGP